MTMDQFVLADAEYRGLVAKEGSRDDEEEARLLTLEGILLRD